MYDVICAVCRRAVCRLCLCCRVVVNAVCYVFVCECALFSIYLSVCMQSSLCAAQEKKEKEGNKRASGVEKIPPKGLLFGAHVVRLCVEVVCMC